MPISGWKAKSVHYLPSIQTSCLRLGSTNMLRATTTLHSKNIQKILKRKFSLWNLTTPKSLQEATIELIIIIITTIPYHRKKALFNISSYLKHVARQDSNGLVAPYFRRRISGNSRDLLSTILESESLLLQGTLKVYP